MDTVSFCGECGERVRVVDIPGKQRFWAHDVALAVVLSNPNPHHRVWPDPSMKKEDV